MVIKDTLRAIDLNNYMEERKIQHVRILRTFEKDNELYYEFVYNYNKNKKKDELYDIYGIGS